MEKKKDGRESNGGKREGSGAKRKEPTSTINFRVPKDKIDFLKPLVSSYIKSLLNPNETQTKVSFGSKPSTGIKAGPPPAPKPKGEPTMAELLRQTYSK